MHGLVPHRPDVQQILHLLVHHCRCLALICLMGYLHHHNYPVSFRKLLPYIETCKGPGDGSHRGRWLLWVFSRCSSVMSLQVLVVGLLHVMLDLFLYIDLAYSSTIDCVRTGRGCVQCRPRERKGIADTRTPVMFWAPLVSSHL